MEDLVNSTSMQNGAWFVQSSQWSMSVWVNSAIWNWWSNVKSENVTLDDWSVVLSNGATLNPADYMLYLFQLMDNLKFLFYVN